MHNSKPKLTPLEVGQKLHREMSDEMSEEQRVVMEGVPYRQAVGSLMYLMICTRPDIAAAVQTVFRFAKNPAPAHWSAVLRIFAYLQKTKNYGLKFKRDGQMESLKLTGFTDSDWGGCQDSRRSWSPIYVLRGCNILDKQTTEDSGVIFLGS